MFDYCMVATMKKKVNFFDRPPSVSSGTPLGKRVVVQHRCDILLEEQVRVHTDCNGYILFH